MNDLSLTRQAALAGRRAEPTVLTWKPTVWVTEVSGRSMIVKDWSRSFWLYRWTLGRLELAREERAYRRLAGLPFVPRLHGRLDHDALLIEHAPARTMTEARLDLQPQVFEQLHTAVAAMHERGILHNDLRHRTNILIDGDGNVRLIDFAASIDLGSGWRRRLFGWMSFIDRSAVVKWWLRYFPDHVPTGELSWYARYLRWRRFWPVGNPRLAEQVKRVREALRARGDAAAQQPCPVSTRSDDRSHSHVAQH